MRRHLLFIVLGLAAAFGQPLQAQEDFPIDAAYRAKVLDGVAQIVGDGYAFADRAAFIREQLSSRKVRARYDTCSTAASLSNLLTRDLQSWSQDRHLKLLYDAQPHPIEKPGSAAASRLSPQQLEAGRARNFGFFQVERLMGNIGYLEIGRFDPAPLAGATATAAMQFLANTDALIIDLRGNGGGSADMVAFMTSFFVKEQTRLATLKRRSGEDDQIWSTSVLGAPLYLGKPVFVLTSKRTFSAAEGLTYDLKHFANAIVVGEKTRGGANPGGMQQIDEHFAVIVPTAQLIHAVTGTNWDADGITPDVPTSFDDAKKSAQRLALQQLLAGKPDEARARMWRQALDELPAPNTASHD